MLPSTTAKRVSAGLPTIAALVADVLADQDAIDAVIGALEETGRLWHVNHSERSMAESAICRIMLTLTQYGFMVASAYKPGDDVTPDFSQHARRAYCGSRERAQRNHRR